MKNFFSSPFQCNFIPPESFFIFSNIFVIFPFHLLSDFVSFIPHVLFSSSFSRVKINNHWTGNGFYRWLNDSTDHRLTLNWKTHQSNEPITNHTGDPITDCLSIRHWLETELFLIQKYDFITVTTTTTVPDQSELDYISPSSMLEENQSPGNPFDSIDSISSSSESRSSSSSSSSDIILKGQSDAANGNSLSFYCIDHGHQYYFPLLSSFISNTILSVRRSSDCWRIGIYWWPDRSQGSTWKNIFQNNCWWFIFYFYYFIFINNISCMFINISVCFLSK